MQETGSRDGQRIAKLLARAGVASRREIERMIGEGRVAVNGTVLSTPATVLRSLHGVTVDGVAVKEPEPARLFLFHKPPGVLTAANDPAGRATIYDRLPKDLPRLVPVGRLDLNTEGLLLLTTDGELKRQLELPATGIPRTYRARAYGDISQQQLEDLIDGIEIDGIRYGSIDANLERRTGANVWIEMTLTEGKNREVRRVLEHLGLQVSRLIRVRYGPFILGDMPPAAIGEVRKADLIGFRHGLAKGQKGTDTTIAVKAPAASSTATPAARPGAVEPDRPRSRPAAPARARPAAQSDVASEAPPRDRRPRSSKPGERVRAEPDRLETRRGAAREPAGEEQPRGRRGRAARGAIGDRGSAASHPAGDRAPDRPTTRGTAAPRRARPTRERSAGDAAGTPRAPTAAPAEGERPARPARIKRGAGWAKPKPKAPTKPRKPRR